MKLQVIGCSHQEAGLAFREQLAFTTDQAREALTRFRKRYPRSEAVLISTCNRVELYTAAEAEADDVDRQAVVEFLADCRHIGADTLMEQLIHRSGAEAVEHLFTVAASLDSMVVGEAQILGQVKQAYELACQCGSAGPLTHAVFQSANKVAKRVARETSIHRRRVSIPSVAVGEVAAEFFERIDDKRVLLLGAGEMGQETLRYLRDSGARDIWIANRSRERAERLVGELGGRAAAWEELDKLMVGADLIVSTTGAAEPVVPLRRFAPIHESRYDRMLLVLDLAVPRDFDPAIGELAGVYLYGVDDLQSACERNRRERQREWPQARKIIAEETRRFIAELHHRATGPVIRRLREQADLVKAEEMQRLMSRLERLGVGPEAEAEVRQSLDRVVNKLLHPPLASLRSEAAAGGNPSLLEALRRLFQLKD